MKRPSFLLVLAALASLCPAPINDVRHAPAPVAERSQAQLAKEQALNGAYAVVGKVAAKEAPVVVASAPRSGTGAGAVASASARVASGGAGTIATGTIAAATRRVEGERSAWHMPAWLLALLAAGFALGAVKGLKAWADRALPAPPASLR